MSDERRFNLQLRIQRRKDPTIDPEDVEGLRATLLQGLSDMVAHSGAAPALFHCVRAGVMETMMLGEAAADPEQELALAAALQQLQQRDDGWRAFRQGEALLRGDDGRLRRAACLLERLGEGGWWLATRFFGIGEAGVGVQYGDWAHAEGQEVSDLPEALQSWLDTSKIQAASYQQDEDAAPAPAPDIQTAFMAWPHGLPDDLVQAAEIIARLQDQEVVQRGLGALLVLVLREEMLERWEVRGELPCTIDELVRNFTGREAAVAAAVVHPCTLNSPDGQVRRGIATVFERDGERATRVLPLTFPPEKQGRPVALAPILVARQEIPPEQRWIGVPPKVVINLTAQTWGGAPIEEA